MMFNNLFIFNSDCKWKFKKTVLSIIGILGGFVFLFLVCDYLNYIYVRYDAWYRILFKSYYSQENIDSLILGSSHAYCDINPDKLDELSGKNNFIMGTPGQRWDDTYFLLKDAIQRNDIENVYIECFFRMSTEYNIWNKVDKEYQTVDWMESPENYFRPWLIAYEMRPSLNSFAMLVNSSNVDYLMETIFPFARYRDDLFNWTQIQKNIDVKSGNRYKKCTYHEDLVDSDGKKGYIEYYPKGFSKTVNAELLDIEKNIIDDVDLDENGIGDASEKYIRKTIELCKKRGINLKLFISPVYDLQLICADNYDAYLSELREVADEYGVELYDFNLIKDEYLDIKKGMYFFDVGHLNEEGIKIFTPVLWNVLSCNSEENKKKFFDSYQDKLLSSIPEIFGISYKDIDSGDEINEDGSPVYTKRCYHIDSNRNNLKYKITKNATDKNYMEYAEVIQDYDTNDVFVLPIDEHGEIHIEAMTEGDCLKLTVKY